LRSCVNSFQKTVDNKELRETLDDRDETRLLSAIYDTANRKISTLPYGLDVNRNLSGNLSPGKKPVGNPSVSLEALGLVRNNSKKSLAPLLTKDAVNSKMLSLAFEHVNSAKTADDPHTCFHEGAMLFDNLEMYDRAVKYYIKSTKATDPVHIVDVKLMPMTDLERRKIDRLGKKQRVEYLRLRNEKRDKLILAEQIKQEKRIQDAHCRLFRVFLILGCRVIIPKADGVSSSSSLLRAAERKRDDFFNKSHAHLRASFRALHPERTEAYEGILRFAHAIMKEMLPPSTPETGAFLVAASGTAGVLQDAHIVVLNELSALDPNNIDVFEFLGKRYAEKCMFDQARDNFKIARDLREADRTPRYASSITLLRHHGSDVDARAKDLTMRTKQVPVNGSTVDIGTDLARSHLLDGRQLAMLKIPISAFGDNEEKDRTKRQELVDYTYFAGRHEGAETRVFLPPSVGWKTQMLLDQAESEKKLSGTFTTTLKSGHS